jgi:hypothetical protein
MPFAIKAEIVEPRAKTFVFTAQKTMNGGKHIAAGDTVFVFASENEGGHGLIARGVVTSTEAIPRDSREQLRWKREELRDYEYAASQLLTYRS